jgi:hypothetical protein
LVSLGKLIYTGHGYTDELTKVITMHGIDYARQHFRFALLEQRTMKTDDLELAMGFVPRKVTLAWAIARSTTMSQSWIATRLSMRSAANGSARPQQGLTLFF